MCVRSGVRDSSVHRGIVSFLELVALLRELLSRRLEQSTDEDSARHAQVRPKSRRRTPIPVPEVRGILKLAREPYRTIFTLAAVTGLRAGELLGLTLADVDFERLMICPRKQADDRTRQLRELKTKRSRTPVPITPEAATVISRLLGQALEEKPARPSVPESEGSSMQAGERRKVRPVASPQETGDLNPQDGLTRLPARARHCAGKQRSLASDRSANLAAYGHQDHVAILRARGC